MEICARSDEITRTQKMLMRGQFPSIASRQPRGPGSRTNVGRASILCRASPAAQGAAADQLFMDTEPRLTLGPVMLTRFPGRSWHLAWQRMA